MSTVQSVASSVARSVATSVVSSGGGAVHRPIQPKRAITFDGVTTSKITATVTGVTLPVTLSAWVNLAVSASSPTIITTGATLGLRFLASTPCMFLSGSNYRYFSGGALTANTWYHLAMVVPTTDAKDSLGYKNGVLSSGSSTATGTFAITSAWQLSGSSTTTAHKIFDAQIIPGALTALQVADLYALGTAALAGTTRKAWWKLDDLHPTLKYDSSGNAFHGTMGGTITDYENADVPHSYQNDVGYTLSGGVYVPRNEAITTQDVLGGPLQYSGPA
jgi:hypothetical protein